MLFKSEAQRRFLYKNKPEVAKEFESKTKGRLPMYVKGSKDDPVEMLKRAFKGKKK